MSKQKEQGKKGEDALNKWLLESRLAYVSICQSTETFSKLFSNIAKRPDFFLLIQSVGLIAIDAKNQTYYETYGNYTLNYDDELRRALMFESLFRIPLWYAFYDEPGNQWYWISALKALEKGELKQQNGEKAESFLAIKRDHFLIIKTPDDLSKLYTHRINDLEKLSKTMHFKEKQRTCQSKNRFEQVLPYDKELICKKSVTITSSNDSYKKEKSHVRLLFKYLTHWF